MKLPILEKTFGAVYLFAYGAATWDWHRMHYDLELARSRGLPGAVIDGQMYGALFARAAMDWAGARGFVTRLSFRMKSMAFAGDTLRAEGELTGVREQAAVLAQRLTKGATLVADATTEVRLAWDEQAMPGANLPVGLARLPGSAFRALVRFPAGWSRPGSGSYSAAEEFTVLEGDLGMNGKTWRKGEHASIAAGEQRRNSSSASGCVAFARFDADPRWTPA